VKILLKALIAGTTEHGNHRKVKVGYGHRRI